MLGRGKSIKYDTEEDQRLQTKSFVFMQNFTATLERNLKLNMSNIMVSNDSHPPPRNRNLSRQNTYEHEDGAGSPLGLQEAGRQMSRSVCDEADEPDKDGFEA